MATILKQADEEKVNLLNEVMSEHHPHLVESGVTVQLLEARSELDDEGNSTGPALKVGGYAALGIASITPYLGRVQGLADALVRIDADWWEDASERECSALLDHELCHFQLTEGDERNDRAGRPRMKMRRHDRQLGFFDEVAGRWGPDSQESQQAQILIKETAEQGYQLKLPLRAVS